MALDLTVDQVLSLDDSSLAEHIRQALGPTGDYDQLKIKDWAEVPAARRELLAQKLRAAAPLQATEPKATAPLDVGELFARLNALSSERDASPEDGPAVSAAMTRSPTKSPPPEMIEDFEIYCYEDLVHEGGLPPFPKDLIGEVVGDPAAFLEMLRPWQLKPWQPQSEAGLAISRERKRWREFRQWQLESRGIPTTERFPDFLERKRREFIMMGAAEATLMPEFERTLYLQWDLEEGKRPPVLAGDRPKFPGFAKAVAKRLSRHGFVRPVRLDADPKIQGRWATWVEYMSFEFACYDKCTESVRRLQRQHDNNWEKLVAAEVLHNGETEEGLLTTEAARRREAEEENAREAWRRVEIDMNIERTYSEPSLQDGRSSVSPDQKGFAQAELDAAQANLSLIQRRNNKINKFIEETNQYRRAKGEAQRYLAKAEWLLDQVKRFDPELNAATRDVPAEKLDNGGTSPTAGVDPVLPKPKRRRKALSQDGATDKSPPSCQPEKEPSKILVNRSRPAGIVEAGPRALSEASKPRPWRSHTAQSPVVTSADTRDEWLTRLRSRPQREGG